ncbi:hypothetical protein CDAR_478751 [Caerostris darwini]|uniref:Uncharacterized protein n=1 Tax=Caerostris darwini TaxID=1538125 RepID=A0AAV4X4J8_9ARAC|nr:hypothetical protein CDAR_478751 [Caerostris darwini]
MPKFPQYLQIPPVRGVPAQSELKVGHCNNSPVVSDLFRDHVLPLPSTSKYGRRGSHSSHEAGKYGPWLTLQDPNQLTFPV